MYSLGTDEYIEYAVNKYSKSLLRISYTILHSSADAEDAVQETFIKLITLKPLFNDTTHEKAWLIRVTINTSRNILKKSLRCNQSIDEDIPVEENYSHEILEAMHSVPEHYRIVLHLYYYEDYTIKEIAKILKLPLATVGTRLSRERALLKKELKGQADYYEF